MPSLSRTCALVVAIALFLPFTLVAQPDAKAAKPPTASQPDPLPKVFAGWQRTSPPQVNTDPAAADAKNVPVLKEYGFNQLATANYVDGDNKLAIRELRFDDATGAYGAFTFYRVPGTSPEEIGREAAANGTHVVFWNGATLVDAVFDHLNVMSAAALRELAGDIPVPYGAKNIAPPLPRYLPQEHRLITGTRYAIGPESYARGGGVLPPALVDFNRGAEVLTGTFDEHNGTGQLTLIEYPTVQIAADRQRAIEAFLKAGNSPTAPAALPWPQPLTDSNTQALLVRRSGPFVAVTSGAFDDADAQDVIGRVHYEATVTWNKPQGYNSEPNRAARLLVGAITLFAILGGIAVLMGIFFGGGRVLVRKLMGKPASSVHEAEFIKLDLK